MLVGHSAVPESTWICVGSLLIGLSESGLVPGFSVHASGWASLRSSGGIVTVAGVVRVIWL